MEKQSAYKKKELGFPCLDEEQYEVQMTEVVEPYLQKLGIHGSVRGLYYEFYEHQEPIGTIVISYGFTESCEKYHELIYYMYQAGYQVAILDHRGHGNSLREVEDPQLVHVDDFSLYVEDLHYFVEKEVLPGAKKLPLYLYAHSMGGCIGTLYLERYPEIFQKAVLNAPMYGINNGGIPDFAAGLLCRGAAVVGKRKKRLFTMGGFDPQEPFEGSGCDSPARHNYYLKRRRENPAYQTSCASYGWAGEAMKAGKRAIALKNAANIRIPVLLFQAKRDTFVRAREQEIFLSRVPDGRKILIDSKHEINRMPGDRLETYLAEMFRFYSGTAGMREDNQSGQPAKSEDCP